MVDPAERSNEATAADHWDGEQVSVRHQRLVPILAPALGHPVPRGPAHPMVLRHNAKAAGEVDIEETDQRRVVWMGGGEGGTNASSFLYKTLQS